MNLAQIVVLLQAVLSLLSNQTVAHNPQVQALATQGILVAEQALANQTTTVGTVNPTPVSITVSSTPTSTVMLPSQPTTTVTYAPTPSLALTAAPSPSCTMTVTHEASNTTPIFSWNAENLPSGFTNTIQYRATKADGVTWLPWQNVPLIRALGGIEQFQSASGTNVNVIDNELYPVVYHKGLQVEYEMSIGGATCDYTVTK